MFTNTKNDSINVDVFLKNYGIFWKFDESKYINKHTYNVILRQFSGDIRYL